MLLYRPRPGHNYLAQLVWARAARKRFTSGKPPTAIAVSSRHKLDDDEIQQHEVTTATSSRVRPLSNENAWHQEGKSRV